MNTHRMVVTGAVVWMAALPLAAQVVYPEFSGRALYLVAPAPAGFDAESLERELDVVNRGSERAYRVVVLDSAGDGAFAARDYNENLRMHWQQQAVREGKPFDARNEVIIVVTLNDRRISMRGGNLLVLRHGLTDDVIERELVLRYFVPAAQQGSLGAGLVDLVRETEDWLDARNLPAAPKPMVDTGLKVVRGERPNVSRVAPTPAYRNSRKAGFLEAQFPYVLLGLVGCGMAGVLLARSRRRARRRAAVLEPYEQYANKVTALLDRIEQLTRRHQLLPYSDPDYTEPMSGETLARYEAVDARIRGLREDWLELMDSHEQMKMLVESTPRLDMNQVAQLKQLLGAAQRLEETTPLANECVEQLDLLENAHEKMTPVRERAEGILAEIRQRLEVVSQAGLSTMPYDSLVQDHAKELEGARALAVADPVGVRGMLTSLEEGLVGLRAWLDDILTARERARAVMAQANTVSGQAAEARGGGLLLTEDEGNPDPMLSQVRQEHDAAMMALDRGEPDTAASYLEQAFTWAGRAGNAIVKQREARQFCESSIPARRQRTGQLADKMQEAQSRRDELNRLHRASAWQAVAENWPQAEKLLRGLGDLLDEAEAAAKPDVQRYFRAEDLLVHVEQQQNLAAELLDAIGLRLKELNALRDACRQRQSEVEALGNETETYLLRHEAVVGPETRGLLDSVTRLRDLLNAHLADEPPDWTLVDQQLQRLAEGYRSVRAQAEDEVRSHDEFIQAIDDTTVLAANLRSLLELHTEDRRRANAAYENAQRELTDIQAERAGDRPDWVGLASRLVGVREGLQRAEQWAREDIDLARQAAAALDQADNQIHQAKSYYRHGVAADVHRAYDLASRARDRLFNHEYERAIEEAAAVEREVQAAMTLAQRRSRDRQREITRQRMAQVATTLIQVAAVAQSARRSHPPAVPRRYGQAATPPINTRPTFPSRSWPRGDTRW